MTKHRVLIVGAGSAGTSAARTLASVPQIDLTLVARTGETPSNRVYVKGVAHGRIGPEQIALPLPDVAVVKDTVIAIDPVAKEARLTAGAQLEYDSLIVATGGVALPLDVEVRVIGHPLGADRVTPLYSVEDGVRVNALLTATAAPRRVIVYGSGFTAAETVSALHADGHDVTLVARSAQPGASAFGMALAREIADAHRDRVSVRFGSAIASVSVAAEQVSVRLENEETLDADLMIVAVGSEPQAPLPWPSGVPVDEWGRGPVGGVYAAGGVATWRGAGNESWRIDHWDDSAAQGEHAARVLLSDVGLGPAQEPYVARSSWDALVYEKAIRGVGRTAPALIKDVPDSGGATLHVDADGTLVGVSAIDDDAIENWSDRVGQHIGG